MAFTTPPHARPARLLNDSLLETAGKPNLIGLNGSGTICDVKTGQPEPSDHTQVMIYMWAVPRALKKFQGLRFNGLVVCPDHEVKIPAESADAAFVENLAGLIKRVSAEASAGRGGRRG